jgi:hypothetical protein
MFQDEKPITSFVVSIGYDFPVYKFIRENEKWSNWTMVLIREYNATSKKKLKREKRNYIEKLCATLNCYIPTQSQTEYYEQNKTKIKEKAKLYRKQNNKNFKHVVKQTNKFSTSKIKNIINTTNRKFYNEWLKELSVNVLV